MQFCHFDWPNNLALHNIRICLNIWPYTHVHVKSFLLCDHLLLCLSTDRTVLTSTLESWHVLVFYCYPLAMKVDTTYWVVMSWRSSIIKTDIFELFNRCAWKKKKKLQNSNYCKLNCKGDCSVYWSRYSLGQSAVKTVIYNCSFTDKRET